MTPSQLMFIKNFQREYKSKFGEDVHIDWVKTKNIEQPSKWAYRQVTKIRYYNPELIESFTKELCEKYKLTLEQVRTTKRQINNREIRNFLIEYAKFVVEQDVNYASAARYINRDRTLIYYYGEPRVH